MPRPNRLSVAEIVLEELMKTSALVEAHGLCLMGKDPNRVVQLVMDELNQLEVWLSIERDFGAMGSTLFTETSSYCLIIADAAAKRRSFTLSAAIYSMLIALCAKTSLMTNAADDNVENLSNDVFDSLKGWTIYVLPEDEADLSLALSMLTQTSNSKNVVDSGLQEIFKEAIAHFE
jgi:hypothetical protein